MFVNLILEGFFFQRLETLVFTIRAMRYLHLCFMTLALPRVASFIAGTLLSLANRCEASSHESPSWDTNITMLSFRAKRLSWISTIVGVLVDRSAPIGVSQLNTIPLDLRI